MAHGYYTATEGYASLLRGSEATITQQSRTHHGARYCRHVGLVKSNAARGLAGCALQLELALRIWRPRKARWLDTNENATLWRHTPSGIGISRNERLFHHLMEEAWRQQSWIDSVGVWTLPRTSFGIYAWPPSAQGPLRTLYSMPGDMAA